MFLDDTACNLASVNLMTFRKPDGSFDIEAYEHAIKLWTVVLEIAVTMAQFPSRRIAQAGERETARKLLGALGRSEDWLACRVALPAERAAEYIELPSGAMRDADASTLADEAQVFVRARAALAEAAPGALLADGRVWPQLVRAEREPRLHALLLALGAEGAIPACLLTDLALRGQPIVRNEVDALESFRRSRLDALIVEDRLYERS
jgi:hypothetical protein